jgi:hypothetical protein
MRLGVIPGRLFVCALAARAHAHRTAARANGAAMARRCGAATTTILYRCLLSMVTRMRSVDLKF